MKIWALARAVEDPHMGGTSARLEIDLWPTKETAKEWEENDSVLFCIDTKTTERHWTMSIGAYGLSGNKYVKFLVTHKKWLQDIRKWMEPESKKVKT